MRSSAAWSSSATIVSSGQISSRTNSAIQSRCAWNSGSVEKSHDMVVRSFLGFGRKSTPAPGSGGDPEANGAGCRGPERIAGPRDEPVPGRREAAVSQAAGEVERVGPDPAGDGVTPAQRHVAHAGRAAAVGAARRNAPAADQAAPLGALDAEGHRGGL